MRAWLTEGMARAGKHCLPLLMANQSGWELLNPEPLTVTWSGAGGADALSLAGDAGRPYLGPAHSAFGAGILSWAIPYVFRTSPGWNLHVRGPVNLPKDGVSALEGLVETDWAVVTFTMNWQLTRAEHPVRFESGEPFCLLAPQRRRELERFQPVYRSIEQDPVTARGAREFVQGRKKQHEAQFLAEFGADFEAGLDLSYFRGRYPEGTPAPEHQTKRTLKPFTSE